MPNRTLIDGTIEIDAPPAEVWKIVSDLRRMGEWSPQCRRMFVFGTPVRTGTRTLNINGQGRLRWPTNAKVVACEPERKLAFRIAENRTVWTYELEATADGGTRVVESRTAPRGVSGVSNVLTEKVLGGTQKFEAALERGITSTLQRIKAEAEGAR